MAIQKFDPKMFALVYIQSSLFSIYTTIYIERIHGKIFTFKYMYSREFNELKIIESYDLLVQLNYIIIK